MENVEDKNPKLKWQWNETPLHYAAQNGHLEVSKLILDNIEDKNPGTRSGKTPLHYAAMHGQPKMWKLISGYVQVRGCRALYKHPGYQNCVLIFHKLF